MFLSLFFVDFIRYHIEIEEYPVSLKECQMILDLMV